MCYCKKGSRFSRPQTVKSVTFFTVYVRLWTTLPSILFWKMLNIYSTWLRLWTSPFLNKKWFCSVIDPNLNKKWLTVGLHIQGEAYSPTPHEEVRGYGYCRPKLSLSGSVQNVSAVWSCKIWVEGGARVENMSLFNVIVWKWRYGLLCVHHSLIAGLQHEPAIRPLSLKVKTKDDISHTPPPPILFEVEVCRRNLVSWV